MYTCIYMYKYIYLYVYIHMYIVSLHIISQPGYDIYIYDCLFAEALPVLQLQHTPIEKEGGRQSNRQRIGCFPSRILHFLYLSLSHSYAHTHTHTHTQSYSDETSRLKTCLL